ncbi:MAG: DAK2 domain-containing protein [Erysipelotrichaceae bacterium]
MVMLTGQLFKEMLKSGAANLANHFTEVDALNVFPVPDGDTGTNMSMTFTSGSNDAQAVSSENLNDVAKGLSKGLLMGARGNSGVILSQIFRGFYQALDTKTQTDGFGLAEAFENGTKVAYKAVMRPVEGTILTVIRESSWYAKRYADEHPDLSISEYMDKLIELAEESLENTPNLLPVLKEVGVVDSGGAGLIYILKGFQAVLHGTPIEAQEVQQISNAQIANFEHDEFGYCTEFIVRLTEDKIASFDENHLKDALGRLGNSIVVVQDEELVKVHVHTLTPGDALNLAQRHGEFVKLKIENMQEQHHSLSDMPAAISSEEPKDYAIIAVAAGDGIANLFKEYRADLIISGGQTMNPSTEDFVAAVKKLNAKHIFILPNNSNIILAAKQAQDILEDQDIRVIESRSIPEGLGACIMFNPEDEVDNNEAEMKDAIARVHTGQLTYAIKDTTFEGIEIAKGDYMGIYEKNIVVAKPDRREALQALMDAMIANEEFEIITVIIGEDAVKEDIEFVTSYIESNSEMEVEVHQGDQPVYSFIFGAE